MIKCGRCRKRLTPEEWEDHDCRDNDDDDVDRGRGVVADGNGRTENSPRWVPDEPERSRYSVHITYELDADPSTVTMHEVGHGNQDAWVQAESKAVIALEEVR